LKTSKKGLFSEKKNPKTFASWHTWSISKAAADTDEQKFFGSSFEKRTYSLPRHPPIAKEHRPTRSTGSGGPWIVVSTHERQDGD
jgi:hypothetical protein